jgi:hypothetical protein
VGADLEAEGERVATHEFVYAIGRGEAFNARGELAFY